MCSDWNQTISATCKYDLTHHNITLINNKIFIFLFIFKHHDYKSIHIWVAVLHFQSSTFSCELSNVPGFLPFSLPLCLQGRHLTLLFLSLSLPFSKPPSLSIYLSPPLFHSLSHPFITFYSLWIALLLMKGYCVYHFISIQHTVIVQLQYNSHRGPFSTVTMLFHYLLQASYHDLLALISLVS